MFKLDVLLKRGGVLASLLLVLGLASGCATPMPGSPEATAEAVDQTVGELPDWYTNLPKEAHSVFAAGTATSPDLQLALDKSTLNAKRSLADRVNSLLSSKIKEFVAEVGQGENTEVMTEVERVTANLITEVSVAGYSQEDAKVLAQGNKYRAYVLLKFPIVDAESILVDRIKKNRVLESKLRASKAFKELEEEIQRARKNN